MKVKDVMTRGVEVVRPGTTLEEASRRMRDLDVGPMPVGEGSRIVGMLTDRDIVIRGVAQGLDPKTATVDEAMTPDVLWCGADDDVKDAARTMKDRQVRRLLVKDKDGRLCGILSLGDLAVETSNEKMSGRVLEEVSQPTH